MLTHFTCIFLCNGTKCLFSRCCCCCCSKLVPRVGKWSSSPPYITFLIHPTDNMGDPKKKSGSNQCLLPNGKRILPSEVVSDCIPTSLWEEEGLRCGCIKPDPVSDLWHNLGLWEPKCKSRRINNLLQYLCKLHKGSWVRLPLLGAFEWGLLIGILANVWSEVNIAFFFWKIV